MTTFGHGHVLLRMAAAREKVMGVHYFLGIVISK
jgi:hypothetical protein